MLNRALGELVQKLLDDPTLPLSPSQAYTLANLPDAFLPDLFFCANTLRRAYKGAGVFTCGIVNAKSGYCSQDCAFCAQSGHHSTGVEAYSLMSMDTMVEHARTLKSQGATRFSMVTSGFEPKSRDLNVVCRTAEQVCRRLGMTVCASLGGLTEDAARQLHAAGVTNYHHNLETARSHFDQVCSTHDYEEDIATVRTAAAAGMRVCCGGIFGLGESWQQRVEMALTIKSLDVPSVPLNFLNPIAGTPMADRPLLSPMEALKCIALYRLILPDRDITICGGRETTLKDYQSWLFLAGANGLMVGNYLTTEGRSIQADLDMIRHMGLDVIDALAHPDKETV
jgi:biotin synthase